MVDVRELGGNVYAVSFENRKSMEMVLEEGPRSIMGCYINLKQWAVDQVIQDICFSKVNFWIQIHHLPLVLMIEKNDRKIRSVLGELIKVEDILGNNGIRRSFLRIRVAVDAEKPLMPRF